MPETKNSDSARRGFGGFFVRRECWTLSWKARLLALILVALTAILYVTQIHSFLATTKTENGEFLIVEGWIPLYASRQAKILFEAGAYRKILTCGTLAEDESGLESQTTYADRGANRLKSCGVPPDAVQAVPAG